MMFRFLLITVAAAAVTCASLVPLTAQTRTQPPGKKPQAAKNEPEVEVLVIEQVCNGFPGTKQKANTEQRVYVGKNMMYMKNLDTLDVCIVRGDKKVVWEIDTKGETYVERLFSYFEKLKKDKLANRATAVRQLNIMPEKQRRKVAEKLGYPVGKDGKIPMEILAKTVKTDEKKKISGYDCYHLQVFEDLRIVFDVWVTKSIKSPKTLMDFYKNLGCFPDEVVAQMEKIEGFPVAIVASLDFGAVSPRVACLITKVEKKKIKKKKFELPKGLKLTKRVGERTEIVQKSACHVCGKEVDPNVTGKNKPVSHSHLGALYYFCTRKHHLRFVNLLDKHKGNTRKVLIILARERARKRKK